MENDLKAAQVIARRAQERAGKLAGAPWTDRALGVVSALSADVHAYVTASKSLFSLLIPTADDRTAAKRSLERLSRFTKSAALGAMKGATHLRTVYKKDGVAGIRNSAERFMSAVLDQIVPVPNASPSPEISEDLSRKSTIFAAAENVDKAEPEADVNAFSAEVFEVEEDEVEQTPTSSYVDELSFESPNTVTSRLRDDLSDVAAKAEKKAREGVSAASARFKVASERFKRASQRFKNVAKENARVSKERIKAAAGDASSRFKNACDIDAIPVAAGKKPLVVMVVFLLILLFLGFLTWKLLDKRKRRQHSLPPSSQRLRPMMGDNLLDDDEESLSDSEDEDGDEEEEEEEENGEDSEEEEDKDDETWYEESGNDENESKEYVRRKYGTQSNANSNNTYISPELPKGVKIRYGT